MFNTRECLAFAVRKIRVGKTKALSCRSLTRKAALISTAEGRRIRNLAVNVSAMSSVRRKLFKEGSNSWASETIGEKQNNDEVENDSAEFVEYTVVNEGDAPLKEQFLENPHGLKTPQENVFARVASSFSEKVKMSQFQAFSSEFSSHHVRFIFQGIIVIKLRCCLILSH